VAMSRRGLARGPLDEQLEARGLTRRVAAVVPSPSGALALALAAAGDLVAIVPGLAVALSSTQADLVSFPLPVPTPPVTVGMSWHRRLDADPTHRWLRGLVRSSLAEVA
jgi:DNA-binding transcriptional LysR family regulator